MMSLHSKIYFGCRKRSFDQLRVNCVFSSYHSPPLRTYHIKALRMDHIAVQKEDEANIIRGLTPDDLNDRPRTVSAASITRYENLDADKVLNAYGKYGKYQMRAYIITSSVHLLFATNMMLMPFITEKANFSCAINEPENSSWVYTVVDSCNILDSNNWTIGCTNIPGASYKFGDDSKASIASSFDLVCDDYSMVEHGSSAFLLGGMISGPIITQLSDIYGRRITFILPLLVAFVSNMLCCLSYNFPMFLILRFIAGVATTSYSLTASVLCMESVSTKFRSILPLLGNFAWVLGYIMAGCIAMLDVNWRVMYFIASIPAIFVIPMAWKCPESLNWLITKNKTKAVRRYIHASTRFNGRALVLDDCKSSNISSSEAKTRTFMDILNHSALTITLIFNCYIFIVMNGTYWALSLYSVDLSENKRLGFFLSGVVEIPAALLASYLMIFFKRKTVAIGALLLTSVCMFIMVFLPVPSEFSIILPLVAKGLNTIIWSVHPLLAGEAAPTSVRNVYSGITSFVGDVGGVAAPYLKRLESVNESAPTLLIAIMSVFAGVFVLILPETKDKPLPEDLDSFDGGPVIHKLLSLCSRENRKQNLSETAPMIIVKSEQA